MSSLVSSLLEKINTTHAHVPASSASATSACRWPWSSPRAGFDTTGIDLDARKVEAITRGHVVHPRRADEPTSRALTAAGKLDATTDFSVVAELDTINICVPTPLRKTKDPDMSYIVSAVEAIAKHLHPGMLVSSSRRPIPARPTKSCSRCSKRPA